MILIQYLFLLFATAGQSTTATLTLEIGEFRNREGHILISVFDSSIGYPGDVKKSRVQRKVKVSRETHQIVIEELPYGDYAVVFLHDENGNEKMDTNFLGAPKEGYGASNDAVNTFSAPKYKDAKFTLAPDTKILKLKIFY